MYNNIHWSIHNDTHWSLHNDTHWSMYNTHSDQCTMIHTDQCTMTHTDQCTIWHTLINAQWHTLINAQWYTYVVTVDSCTPNTPELAIAVRGSLAAAELVKYCKISCNVPCGYIFSVDFTLRPFFNSATGNYGDYRTST